MARINPNEMDNYQNNNKSADWLRLQNDGDVARVQFLANKYEDMDAFVCHKVEVNGKERYVDCKRSYDDPLDACPFCSAGYPLKSILMLSMYDLNDGKVKIWERGKSFRKIMEGKYNRYPNGLSNEVFEIERHGSKGSTDTTYEVIHIGKDEGGTPVDLSEIEKPEFMGSFILDKTPDEMQYYVEHKEFPQSGNEDVSRRGVTRRGSVD